MLRAFDLLPLLQERFAMVTGGRDRRGGSIIYLPATPKRDRIKLDDYRRLFSYMINIASEESKTIGFTVIIDMRGSSNISGNVKPILKLLQENFTPNIHQVIIIKVDNFWPKQRASISAHKYKFETSIICIESLSKLVDLVQITTDLGGTLAYDHGQWIDLRLKIEEFSWQVRKSKVVTWFK